MCGGSTLHDFVRGLQSTKVSEWVVPGPEPLEPLELELEPEVRQSNPPADATGKEDGERCEVKKERGNGIHLPRLGSYEHEHEQAQTLGREEESM